MATLPSKDGTGDALPSKKNVIAAATSALSGSVGSSLRPSAAVSSSPSSFQVVVSGQIESIAYPGVSNLYCRYAVTYGTDWRVLHGADAGLTQLAYRSSLDDDIVFNFPIDLSFNSTNPFGWPRLVFSVYGLDALGRDVVRGYGSTHIPTTDGRVTRLVPLFRPLSSSWLQQFVAWLTGSPPEYFDAKFIAQNAGREVTRVTSEGKLRVQFNVATRGLHECGYAASA
ncbi:hypothetical protein P43SY_000107 [Pythium insidiosum]|uniref:B9 domain-containing protein 1 n=1 Tax=Pythium insidiosum TaxID=114742 RepID=A0AAD5Q297_PYTIN|nr:hypothetical protein P43SY_000107 [Pythium insidiosum]